MIDPMIGGCCATIWFIIKYVLIQGYSKCPDRN